MQIGLAVKKFQGTERFRMTTQGHIGVQKMERQPCWCPKTSPVCDELRFLLIQKKLHRCSPRYISNLTCNISAKRH